MGASHPTDQCSAAGTGNAWCLGKPERDAREIRACWRCARWQKLGKQRMHTEQMRSGAVEARRAHNPEVAGSIPACATKRGYAALGLYMPKAEANVGGAMRAAYCYGAAMVAVQGQRFKSYHTDTMKAWRHIPVVNVPSLLEAIPFSCTPVCVELSPNARPLHNFVHPERAFYIFGPEDGSVPTELTSKYITVAAPSDFCMNLAATVNVVLYDRRAKSFR